MVIVGKIFVENHEMSYCLKQKESTSNMLKRITFPQRKGTKKICSSYTQVSFPQSTRLVDYKEELIFAMMSRIWFCKFSSPAFKALSTLRMECIMVVWSLLNSSPMSVVERFVSFRIR